MTVTETATTLQDVADAAVGTLQRAEYVLPVSVRAEAEDERTITGTAVPYGVAIEHMFGREMFDPGSVEDAETAVILWQHDRREPIGRVTAANDGPDQLDIDARLSTTVRATDALTLTRDDVVTGLSIGFEPLEYRIEKDDETGTETLHWTRVRAREFSLVTFPAYDTARTRAASTLTPPSERTTPMPTAATRDVAAAITREDLAAELDTRDSALDERLTDLQRAVQLVGDQGRDSARDIAAEAQRFDSIGDFVQSLARGDEQAASLYTRAFGVRAEGTTADVAAVADVSGTAGWLGNFIRLIENRRRIANLFSKAPLPAKGMTVSYAQLATETLQVGKQASEGTALPGPGKLTFTPESEPVETFGGWTDLSRQVIERSDVPYLDTMWKAFAIKYARETNQALRDRVLAEVAGITTAAVAGTTISIPATPTIYDYFDAIVDAGERFDETGFSMDGLLVDKATFKALARMEGNDGRPMMTVYGTGANVVGEVNLPDGEGNIGRVPVRILFGAPANTKFFYDSAAAELRESSGAPVRLQDDDIVNLSKAFSLYGYAAVTVPFPGALVPLVNAAA